MATILIVDDDRALRRAIATRPDRSRPRGGGGGRRRSRAGLAVAPRGRRRAAGPAHAGDGRHGGAAPHPGQAQPAAGRRADRRADQRQHDRGDAAGRGGPPRQADRPRWPAGAARANAAGRRAAPPRLARRGWRPGRRPGRLQRRHARCAEIDRPAGRQRRHRAAAGGNRHRQGGRGARHPPARHAAPRRRSSRSTAPRFRPSCWRACCSAMCAAPSPAPSRTAPARSARRRAARCSWTRSATWTWRCRPSCCARLQERVVTPVGGRPVPIDVRVIAATHRDLLAGGARRAVPRGPVLPARRGAGRAAAAARAPGRYHPAGRALPGACRQTTPRPSASPPMRPPGCWRIPGPAMCASC